MLESVKKICPRTRHEEGRVPSMTALYTYLICASENQYLKKLSYGEGFAVRNLSYYLVPLLSDGKMFLSSDYINVLESALIV